MILSDYLAKEGLSPTQFAERVGVDRSLVSRWVSRKCVPSDLYKIRIFEITAGCVTPNDLIVLPGLSEPASVPRPVAAEAVS